MDPQEQTKAITRRFVQIGFMVVLQTAALFLSAGRWNWLEGWIYIGSYIAYISVNAILLLPHHKDLVAERSRISKNTKPWDRVISLGSSLPGLVMLIIAGLDVRYGWSAQLTAGWKIAGIVMMLAGYAVWAWAMTANPYFAVTVHIQSERGHKVATGGPYRIVRHPAYASLIVSTVGMLLLFSSAWAVIPVGVMFFFLVLRTALEDCTLRAELAGYKEYAQKTRYRLIPGIW
jgi:protein-S-isoprenylcysteine O-methyltransferase Ste14